MRGNSIREAYDETRHARVVVSIIIWRSGLPFSAQRTVAVVGSVKACYM